MKIKCFLRNAFSIFAVLYFTAVGFCQTADELVEQGKTEFIENKDIYAADAKFAGALALDSNHQKANFWRAITVVSSNPDLKQMLKDLEIISNDGNDSLLILDKEDNIKWSDSPISDVIIDNEDGGPGYTETGSGWVTSAGGSYGNDCRVHPAGDGSNVAVWAGNITTPGKYNVNVSWRRSTDNAPDAKFGVYYDGGNQTYARDQRRDYDMWNGLGSFTFSPGQPARVELSDNASSGNVVADAVRFEYVGGETDDGEAVFTNGSSSWETIAPSNGIGGSHKVIAAGSDGTCVWTPNIPTTGKYSVKVRFMASGENAIDAAYTVTPADTTPTTILVDQQRDNWQWMSLGLYDFQAGAGNTITLAQNSGGKVIADAVRVYWLRDFPNLTEGQSVQVSALSEIDQALTYLGKVDNTFQDTANFASLHPDTSAAELDYGDALIFKAALNLLKARINETAAYNMDNTDPAELDSTYTHLLSVNYVLDKYTNLGRLLAPDYTTRLTNAKTALITAINSYLDGYDFIKVETDLQDDDFITFNSEDSDERTDSIHPKLREMRDNLNGALPSVIFSIDDPFFDDISDDMEDSFFKMPVNFREFYDNPKDQRALLPQFDSNDEVIRSTVPDPTFGGVLPNMTQEELNGMLKLGSRLFRPRLSWDTNGVPSTILDWKKDTYNDFVRYAIYRSTTDTVNETSTKIYDSVDKDITTFTDTTIDPDQTTYYYRLYTYYSNGDKAASAIRRVRTEVYVNISTTSQDEDGTPEHPYKLLRDGIDASSDGAKVLVAQGTYNECEDTLLLWRREGGLYLEGGYEPAYWTRNPAVYETIIDGTDLGGGGVVGLYNMDSVLIDGFTIKGPQNYGIQTSYSTNVVIKKCTLRDTRYGIYATTNSSLTLENCKITQTQSNGAGVYNSDNVSLVMKDCEIYDNGKDGIFIQNVSPNKWYKVYGGNTYISGVQGYSPENYGYTFLGSDPVTMSFQGSYNYYCIVTDSGQTVLVDTVQGSSGNYYGTNTTGNTENWGNVGGAPDGAYATVGGSYGGWRGGYILIDPPAGNSWIKVYIVDSQAPSANVEISNCIIRNNASAGIHFKNCFNRALIKNNLIESNQIFGIGFDGRDSPTIINNTVANNVSWGIAWSSFSTPHGDLIEPIINNNIITGHSVGIHFENGVGNPTIDYNGAWGNTTVNYSGCSAGPNDISQDPLFAAGPRGNYYLSQTAAGEATNSPCVDIGNDTAVNLGLQNLTTRTDGVTDAGTVDLGYHYLQPNRAPVLSAIGNKLVNENQKLEFGISATDPDGDFLLYSASNLPLGASLNPATRIFTWTPTYEQTGVYTGVKFTVSDGALTDDETITITVNNVNRRPVLEPIGTKTIDEGKLLQFSVNATDPDGDRLFYLVENRPGNATFFNKIFKWTPTYEQAGTYNVTFRVRDGFLTASEIVSIEVKDVPAPNITRIEPVESAPGVVLSIWGKNFGPKTAKSIVEFQGADGTTNAAIVRWNDDFIKCAIPQLEAGDYAVRVINKVGRSNATDFKVLLPYIRILAPWRGRPGTAVAMYGRNFGPKSPASKVYFYNYTSTVEARITAWLDGSIRCTAPNVVRGYYKVKVVNSAGESNSRDFTVLSY